MDKRGREDGRREEGRKTSEHLKREIEEKKTLQCHLGTTVVRSPSFDRQGHTSTTTYVNK